MSYSQPVLSTSGNLNFSDIRILDINTVHINSNESISGQKTFNNILSTLQGISNTGNISTETLTVGGNVINSNSTININGSINILSGNYISFGPNYQNTSYGLRDNNGIIEYKENSGYWKNISYIEDNSITLSKINNNNGTGTKVILDNNTFGKITDNVITDNTLALTKLSGLVSTNTIANVVLDNGSLGKVSNNVITDNTINGIKLLDNSVNISKLNGGGTGLNVVLDNNTIGKVSNNVITDNTINPTKLVTPNDQTKYLRGDGSWNSFSSGITNSGLLITNGISNTGNISTESLLASNGKKYLRLLNISNYNNTSYVQSTIIVNTTPYIKIDLSTIIKSSLINTFLSIYNNDCVFNEIGDYYVCVNIIYSIDTTLIKKINVNFSFDNLKSMIDQDINILNFKYQNDLSQIYNITNIDNPNTQYLRLYVQCSDSITLTIHKINLDIVKLN